MKQTVAIIGVGLIGGSLGMALKKSGHYRVIGIGRNAKRLAEAKRRGAVHEVSTDPSAVRLADIVVLCTPVDAFAAQLRAIKPFLKPGAIITDAGSVKVQVLRDARKILSPEARKMFIGGHPMAGSEKNGVGNAEAGLYKGAVVALTPEKDTSKKAISAVRALWKAAGASTIELPAQEHDRIVAVISHLPHVLAFTLSAAASELSRRSPAVKRLIAGSFRDMTRVADSSPRDWATICSANPELASAITRFAADLTAARSSLKQPRRLEQSFAKARQGRQKLLFH